MKLWNLLSFISDVRASNAVQFVTGLGRIVQLNRRGSCFSMSMVIMSVYEYERDTDNVYHLRKIHIILLQGDEQQCRSASGQLTAHKAFQPRRRSGAETAEDTSAKLFYKLPFMALLRNPQSAGRQISHQQSTVRPYILLLFFSHGHLKHNTNITLASCPLFLILPSVSRHLDTNRHHGPTSSANRWPPKLPLWHAGRASRHCMS